MNSNSVGTFIGALAVFVIATITAEYVSRKIWPRAAGQ